MRRRSLPCDVYWSCPVCGVCIHTSRRGQDFEQASVKAARPITHHLRRCHPETYRRIATQTRRPELN